MSVALSSHINSLKELLIDCKDSASKARHRLTDARLTTVMGASFKEGKVGPAARRRLLEEDTALLQHISDADQDKVLERASNHIKLAVENRLAIVLSSLLTALKLEVSEEIIAPLDNAAKCINSAFTTVRDVAHIAALDDVSMTPPRALAIDTFNKSINFIEETVTRIHRLDAHIVEVQEKLEGLYDDKNVLGTAQDADRTSLSSLRKDLEGQRLFVERQLLEHFDESARARTSDVRMVSVELKVPSHLISKGRGLELDESMLPCMLSRAHRFYAIMAYYLRLVKDFDASTGCFWKPPSKSTGYSDVPQSIRKEFVSQNSSFASYLTEKVGQSILTAVTTTYSYGIHGDLIARADSDDGLAIYFGLMSLSRPSASAYREEIENKLTDSIDHFKRGNPAVKISHLRPILTEALRLRLKIKWSIGVKIITTLSLRHSTFAVDLKDLKNTAPNTDDAAVHLDKLFNQIEKSCQDIQAIQGDSWQEIRANFTSGYNARDCRYGTRCTRTDCRYNHPSGKDQKPSGGHQRRDNKDQTPAQIICHHKPCKQRTGAKFRKFCPTCFKLGLQKGTLPLKDGGTRSFKQAQRARSNPDPKEKRVQKQQKNKEKESTAEVFSPEQMEVLGAMAHSSKASMYDVLAETPAGPLSFKRKHVMERLGDYSRESKPLTGVQSALAKLNITLENPQ